MLYTNRIHPFPFEGTKTRDDYIKIEPYADFIYCATLKCLEYNKENQFLLNEASLITCDKEGILRGMTTDGRLMEGKDYVQVKEFREPIHR